MFFKRQIVCLILVAVIVLSYVIILNLQDQPIAHGIVYDKAAPVAGAVVRLRGRDHFTLTDKKGYFRLAIDNPETQLTAWAPGYFVAGGDAIDFIDSDGASLLLRHHPTLDNPDYAFISPLLDMNNPTACAHCHQEKSGSANGAMPVDEWLLDAHSSAATNPRFLSLYNGTGVEGIPGTPTTFQFKPLLGISVPDTISLDVEMVGPGFRLDFPEQDGSCAACHVPVLALEQPYHADPNQANGVAREGITCDFCHKIQEVRLSPDGRPYLGLPGILSLSFLRPQDGEQVFIGQLDDTPGDDIYSPLLNQSQFCAACHSGQFWDVKIYDSFGEWLDSPYSDPESGQTCQDCHMPHTGATSFAQLPPDNSLMLPPRNPETIYSHRMPGAADKQLLQNTASLEVATQQVDNYIQVVVRVTNTGAGHHIPTDSPLRNMILLVQVEDQDRRQLTLIDGPTIPAWGGEGDSAEGYYAGQPGVLYAKVLADFYTGESPTYAYWRQTRLVSDNRIPALEADETVYTFAMPSESKNITVEVRLYLRRAFIELMNLKGWNVPDILMEQQVVSIP